MRRVRRNRKVLESLSSKGAVGLASGQVGVAERVGGIRMEDIRSAYHSTMGLYTRATNVGRTVMAKLGGARSAYQSATVLITRGTQIVAADPKEAAAAYLFITSGGCALVGGVYGASQGWENKHDPLAVCVLEGVTFGGMGILLGVLAGPFTPLLLAGYVVSRFRSK